MKKLFLFTYICFNLIFCQKIGISLYTNPHYSDFTKTKVDFNVEESSKINYGVSLNITIDKLDIEIGFVEQISFKQEYFSEKYIGDGIRSIVISYKSIPILFKYNFVEKKGFHIYPIIGVNKIINYSINDNIDYIKGNESGSLIHNYNDIQYSYILGLGVQRYFTDNVALSIDYLFSRSFSRIQERKIFDYGNPYIYSHGIRFAVKYDI